MSDFYKYFKENMDGLNLPAPEFLFYTVQVASANAMVFLRHIDKFGKTVTVGEVIGAATKLEQLEVIATLSACYYVGAVIGSIAVATGRSLAGGTSLSDVLLTIHQQRLERPWLTSMMRCWPGIYDNTKSGRKTLHHRVVAR